MRGAIQNLHAMSVADIKTYSLVRATQLGLIKLQLVSRQHYPNQGSPHLIQSHCLCDLAFHLLMPVIHRAQVIKG